MPRFLIFQKFCFLKYFLGFLYIVPFFVTILEAFKNSANPTETLQNEFGNFSVYFLLATLYLSPLKRLFPQISFVSELIKHRRGMGLACFFYAMLHLCGYFLMNPHWEVLQENFFKPFVYWGVVAFLIIFAMGITSNRFAVKKLGGKNWKRLQRLVYFLIPLLFFHLYINNKGDPERAYVYFLPILLLEIHRYVRYIFTKKQIFK